MTNSINFETIAKAIGIEIVEKGGCRCGNQIRKKNWSFFLYVKSTLNTKSAEKMLEKRFIII